MNLQQRGLYCTVYGILVVESIVIVVVIEPSVNSIVVESIVVEHNLYSIVVVVIAVELTLYSQSGAVTLVELSRSGANSGAFDSTHGICHGENRINVVLLVDFG